MNATIKRLTLLAAVFAPFLMTGAALLVLPDPWQTFRNTHAEDWIWLILLGGMMLAMYYFAGVYLEDEEEITRSSRPWMVITMASSAGRTQRIGRN